RAAFRLAAAQAGKPGPYAEFGQCAAHRFDLVAPVVFVEAGDAALPGAAVTRFLPGRALPAPVHLEIEREAVAQFVDETVGFREQVAGVDEYDRDVGLLLRQQMQRHRRLRAEARRQ